MKHNKSIVLPTVTAICGIALSTQGQVIVNDTWLDGNRNDPASAVYSEYGVDSDLDGDTESAWFRGGAGAFDPVGPGGPLRLSQASASSSSLTTYFTPEGSELTLANAGDSLKLTWQFSVSGTVGANTSQGLRVALVDSPSASRVTGNASPAADAYSGYGMFMNMDTTLTHGSPFQIVERNVASGNLLSSSSAWIGLASDGTSGNTGYIAGTSYTFMMSLTRNGLGGIDILARMAGGSLDNDGLLSVAFTDTTPNAGSFAFDTFEFRPDGNDVAYDVFDTTLFRVELTQVPEPASTTLLGMGLLGLFSVYRRSRK